MNQALYNACSQLVEEMVELLWDDNESNCKISNCTNPSSISCGNRLCIDENIEYWKDRIKKIFEENK